MIVGDIVRLKSGHHLNELIKGNCYITGIVKYSDRRTRYHITDSCRNMTWVYSEELDLVSYLRDGLLNELFK